MTISNKDLKRKIRQEIERRLKEESPSSLRLWCKEQLGILEL